MIKRTCLGVKLRKFLEIKCRNRGLTLSQNLSFFIAVSFVLQQLFPECLFPFFQILLRARLNVAFSALFLFYFFLFYGVQGPSFLCSFCFLALLRTDLRGSPSRKRRAIPSLSASRLAPSDGTIPLPCTGGRAVTCTALLFQMFKIYDSILHNKASPP